MRANLLPMAVAVVLWATPFAIAQNDTGADTTNVDVTSDGDDDTINVDADDDPDTINVDADDDDRAQESVGIGWTTTTVILVLVGAVLLVALIVGLAGRDRWWP